MFTYNVDQRLRSEKKIVFTFALAPYKRTLKQHPEDEAVMRGRCLDLIHDISRLISVKQTAD